MTTFTIDRTPAKPKAPLEFDEHQLAVIQHTHGAMRVLAGPGTGKTTTLVAAMAHRLEGENALSPTQVLGLTFGRKAALEWRDQVTLAVGGGIVPLVSTFHSFCYALIRKYQDPSDYQVLPKLLSGPEQQTRARQLFADAVRDGRVDWPEELSAALDTRGLADEVRAVIAKTRSFLLDPNDLTKLGQTTGHQTWVAIGNFMEEYLDVLDLEGSLDYSELVHRAVILCHQPHVQEDLHKTFKAIYVDEYQDTDPSQVALLKALLSPDSSLIVVGDNDQAIYGFRGADESGIRNFPEVFAKVYNKPTTDVVLQECRRFGPQIREVAKAVIDKYRPSGIAPDILQRHRNLECLPKEHDQVEAFTFDSDGAQAAHIVNMIARAHANSDYAWSDMAVIVRSAVTSLPMLYRAFVSAGVPVEVAADEIPLHLDPAVEPLLDVLRVIDNPDALTPHMATQILQGPLGRLDPLDLRRFGRYLRRRDASADRVAAPSTQLVRDVLADARDLLTVPETEYAKTIEVITQLWTIITQAREKMQQGATPHQVLWHVWQATDWPVRLEEQALAQGSASRFAHRDLDAICALFDLANRFVERGRGKDLTNFLAELQSQEIPAQGIAEANLRRDAVRLLTAHRAKGLQWKYVVVAGVQEDLWPDIRMRQTLLQADRIGPGYEAMPLTNQEILQEERRLFYVALTRAMEHLVITAVDSSINDDGVAPSRFFQDFNHLLANQSPEHVRGRPAKPLTVDGVIASLRAVLLDDTASEALQNFAAQQLARLANHSNGAFKHAHPDMWWATKDTTHNVQGPVEPVGLSASSVRSIEECPTRWFLERQVQATSESQTYFVFGNVMHTLAEGIQNNQIPLDSDAVRQRLDRIWSAMGYEAPCEAKVKRQEAEVIAERMLHWFLAQGEVEVLSESALDLRTTLTAQNADGTTRTLEVRINGRADRIQFDADGVVVYDFKTSSSKPSKGEILTDVQLALYTYLLEHGQFESAGEKQKLSDSTPVKGAALLQLKFAEKGTTGDAELPLTQFVAADSHDEHSDVSLSDRLTNAALIMLDETYTTRFEEQKCERCPMRILCPEAPEGRSML